MVKQRALMSFDGRIISNVGVLAAVAETGSFTKAADSLGLTRSGISRAVQRLEESVGIRLFERNTRSVTLTDDGRRFYARIAPLMSGLEEAVDQAGASANTVRGRLRVNTDPFFARQLFAPHAAAFLAQYPELTLELAARDHLGDLVAEGFDLAIRFGMPQTPSLMAVKLAHTHTVTVAAPAYLAQHGTPRHPSELENHFCLQMRDSMTGRPIETWQYRHGSQDISVAATGRFVADDYATMLQACLAGLGIMRIKAIGITPYLDAGALVEIFPGWRGQGFALQALRPSRQLAPAKTGAFIEFIRRNVIASMRPISADRTRNGHAAARRRK
jgi:Transcriptional regulator